MEKLQGMGFWVSNFCLNLAPFLSSFIAAKSAWDRFGQDDERTVELVNESRGCAAMVVDTVLPLMRERSMRRAIYGDANHATEMGLITDATRGSDRRADGSQATPAGYGIWFMGYFARGVFPAATVERATNKESGLVDNSHLEMVARTIGVLMMQKLWPVEVERRTVRVSNCNDNSATIGQIRKGRAKWGLANDCLLCTATLALRSGVDIVEEGEDEWVASAECIFGDSLSRSIGTNAKAEEGWQRFLIETGGRPTKEIRLKSDAPFWSMQDALAFANYDDFDVPPLPLAMFLAWQPERQVRSEGKTGETKSSALRFLAGAGPAGSSSGLGCDTGPGGAGRRATPCTDGSPSSSTKGTTPRGNGTPSSSISDGSSSETGTRREQSTGISRTCKQRTERSSRRKSSESSVGGSGGGGGCVPQQSERPTERGRHRKSYSGPQLGEHGAESSMEALRRQWSWHSSGRYDAANTRRFQGERLENFNCAGVGWYSGPRTSRSARQRAGDALECPSKSTGSRTEEHSDSGSLFGLLATPMYVQYASYESWRGKAGLRRTGPFSRKRRDDTYQAMR
jgi:hypothetical protein